jgi:WD40 repeat protein
MAGLFFFANIQRDRANENAVIADENRALAEEQALIAVQNEQEANVQRREAEQQKVIAEEQRVFAEEQKLVAQAQRSAARAQIYQIQPDQLYTSTLLAVASWKTSPSGEANEILRKNISLLPIPVKQMYQEGGINSLEFNTMRDLFVTGGGDGKACVWRASDGGLLYCSISPKSVNDAVFSPDGEFIVTGDSSGEVQIIRTLDWSVVNSYNTGSIVWDIDIGNDGKDIAATRDDGRITIIELATGEIEYDLFVTGKVRIASFSPNGVYIAAGASSGVVTLWNLNSGGTPITSGRHSGEVLALAFSPDSRYLVTGGADGYAVTARTLNGQESYRLLHEDAVTDIAFNPSGGTWFATVSTDRRIRLWNTINGNERIRMSQTSFVDAVDVSANGQWLATTGADRTVRVWNASSGTQMFQIPLASEGTVLGFGEGGNSLVAGDETGQINVWDISVMPVPENYLQFGNLVGDMLFSPSGEWLAASSGDRVWLLRSEQLPTLASAPTTSLNIVVTGNVSSLAFSPDSTWLGVSTEDGNVLVYNLSTKVYQTLIPSGTEHDIVFSSDSAYLIVSQPGGSVDAWNLETREQIVAFVGSSQEIESLAIGASRIALGVENEILLLNSDGEMISSIESPGDHTLLLFNEDETMLASSNSEGFIEIWDLDNGTASLAGSIRKETLYSMDFNPAGTQLAVGTTNTIYLIDPTTAEEVARIPHADIVTAISYSGDGSIMATSSLKAVQFWDMTKIPIIRADDLVDAACKRLTANFSESQWNNLFGGEEYQVLCDDLPVP